MEEAGGESVSKGGGSRGENALCVGEMCRGLSS